MKKKIAVLSLFLAAIGVAATIGTLGSLPDVSGGVFTQQNHDQINTNTTTANTNFTNVNSQLATLASLFTGLINCATTAACPSTAELHVKLVIGQGTLATGSPSTYAVTTMSPAFTSATSYTCLAQDTAVIATNIGVLTAGYVSGSAVTFTGPNTTTDTFNFYCVGY